MHFFLIVWCLFIGFSSIQCAEGLGQVRGLTQDLITSIEWFQATESYYLMKHLNELSWILERYEEKIFFATYGIYLSLLLPQGCSTKVIFVRNLCALTPNYFQLPGSPFVRTTYYPRREKTLQKSWDRTCVLLLLKLLL